jgi:putative tricarboxylic transport membrane protein
MSRTRELIVGAAMLGLGAAYLILVADVPRRGPVDASFVPRVLAWMMLGLGALQTLAALRIAGAGKVPRASLAPLGVVATSMALIAAFVAMMVPLGFPVAAALFLFAQFWLLTPAGRQPRPVAYAALAVVASLVIFLTFRYGFRLLLPAGPLTPFLP